MMDVDVMWTGGMFYFDERKRKKKKRNRAATGWEEGRRRTTEGRRDSFIQKRITGRARKRRTKPPFTSPGESRPLSAYGCASIVTCREKGEEDETTTRR